MFRDVDAAIMMPGATTAHPAYAAMQDWLKDDLTEHRGRRTIHFHWVENGSAYAIAGQPLPIRPAIDALYQRALLQTDYRALADVERRFAAALRAGEVRITSAAGTDLRFRAGDRPVNLQDGDASQTRAGQGQVLIDKEIELPAGAIRVAPIEDSVEGVIAFPPSQWDGRPVEGLKLRFVQGPRRGSDRDVRQGGRGSRDAKGRRCGSRLSRVRTRIQSAARGSRPCTLDSVLRLRRRRRPAVARRQFRAGGSRRSTTPGPAYVRWNFFTDLTVTVGNTTWVRAGTLANP